MRMPHHYRDMADTWTSPGSDDTVITARLTETPLLRRKDRYSDSH